MDIKNLDINNFLTIGEAKLELDNRGLLLIQGVNNDDPSAKSNGAGKSSIVDALCWAIYGVTARGVSSDSVVNKTAKKDCQVCVTLTDGAQTYRIERYRKHVLHKNQVFVFQQNTGTSVNLSKGTDRETQEVINDVMGCSIDVFMAAVYAGQERMPDLPGMTDKMLKALIEEAAGVEVLTEAYTVARGRLNSVKAKVDSFMPMKVSVEANLAAKKMSLLDQIDKSAIFERGRKERAKETLVRILPIKQTVGELTDMLKKTPLLPLQEELKSLEDKIKTERQEKEKLAELTAAVSKANSEATRLKTQYEFSKKQVEKAEKALLEIDEQVGKSCGECGKVYEKHELATARVARLSGIDHARGDLVPIATALKAAIEKANAASDAAEKFEDSMTDFTAVAAKHRDLTAKVNEINITERNIAAKMREIEAINVLAKSKLSEENVWTKIIEATKVEIAKIEGDLYVTSKRLTEMMEQFEILENAVKVFGPAGVRAHILDTVTPYLNDRTRDYLGALGDGNIHAEWNTLAKTAKGELKEKFNIEVTNDKGAESFAGLSGGEKRKVRLATAMALQDMVASRATKPIGMFIGDEIDDALDDAGLERLMGILERKAKECGTVLIVSHNALSDWCTEVITVSKVGGYASVSGSCAGGAM